MKTKICTKCKEEKQANTEYFGPSKVGKYGLRPRCRICANEDQRLRRKTKGYWKPKKFVVDKNKVCTKCKINKYPDLNNYYKCSRTKDGLSIYCKECSSEHQQQPHIKDARNKWRRKYDKNLRATDKNFQIKQNVSRRIREALFYVGKTQSTIKYLGCDIESFRWHLESQFQEGMTWENYGEWEIDHIVPLSIFNLEDIHQQKYAFHYTNCQPLWKHDNLSKLNRF